MIFNRSRLHDFLPQLFGENNEQIEIVEKTRLLGLVVRSDLKWIDNTENMCSKAYSRLWSLRQLKSYGASTQDLVDVWVKQGRSLLEYAVPVWGGNITEKEQDMLEACQKVALAVILGDGYKSYKQGLHKTGLNSLKSRRVNIMERFSMKTYKNDKYKNWFQNASQPTVNTRQVPRKLKPVRFNTQALGNSTISMMTEIINEQLMR